MSKPDMREARLKMKNSILLTTCEQKRANAPLAIIIKANRLALEMAVGGGGGARAGCINARLSKSR